MKPILLFIFLFISGNEFKGDVSTFNKVKKEAETAYQNEDYKLASEKYSYLIDSLKYQDDNAKLNLAHSYYKMEEIDQAKSIYQTLSASADPEVNSIANQQMGIFESKGQNLQKSLDYFKRSLKANPTNEEARYNYELVKKKLDEQNQQDQNQENQDENKEDQKDQEKKDQEKKDQEKEKEDQQNKDSQDQEKKDQEKKKEEQKEKEEQEKEQNEDKQNQEEQQNPEEKKEDQAKPQPNFEEKEISKEMAEMILQAMRNKELQYLQQLKKQPKQPVDKGKPDW